MCCCCSRTTLRATAGRWRRCGAMLPLHTGRALRAKRRRLHRCRCNMPTTPCGNTRCLARRRPQQPHRAAACVLDAKRCGSCRTNSSCRPIGRGPRSPAIAAATCRCRSMPNCTAPCSISGRDSQASLFMVLQAALTALLARLGAGTDIAIGSPFAGRTRCGAGRSGRLLRQHAGAAHRHVGQSELARTDRTRVRSSNLAAYAHQDLPFERLVEVLKPERSLSRHPLFQVMLVMLNDAPAGFALPGLTAAFEPISTGAAKFDLALALGEQRAADGSPAGITGAVEYATDLFDRATRRSHGGAAAAASRGGGCSPDRPIGSFDILSAPSATPSCASGTTRRVRCRPAPCRNCLPRKWREHPIRRPSCSAARR